MIAAASIGRQAVADELTAIAIDLEQLRHDPRDPSKLILGKIDVERRIRRLSRRVVGRE